MVSSWDPPPSGVVLGDEDIHVWCLNLAELQGTEAFCTILSADEFARASQHLFKEERERWVAIRGALRIFISAYLDCHPRGVTFFYNRYGKPTLGENPLQFNLSHSGDIALYAFTKKRAIGIDVEKNKTDFQYERIAKRCFTPRENSFINTRPLDERGAAFFSVWTQKEAYLKAKGQGLSVALDSVDVCDENSSWRITALKPAPGYSAALAVEGCDGKLSCRELGHRSWISLCH